MFILGRGKQQSNKKEVRRLKCVLYKSTRLSYCNKLTHTEHTLYGMRFKIVHDDEAKVVRNDRFFSLSPFIFLILHIILAL